MQRRDFLLATATAAAGIAAPQCWSAAPVSLRRARVGNLTTLDPHRPISAADMDIATDLFEGLTAVGSRGELVAGCAARWSVSPDGLEYRFELREGLRWSDGAPLVASDVVASLQRLLAPETAALLGYRFDAIRGARELRTGQGPAAGLGVSADGARGVTIRLRHPDTDLLKLLAVAYVVPTGLIAQRGRDWARPGNIVVNGAYLPTSWAQGGTLQLERNAQHRDHARRAPSAAVGAQPPAVVHWVMGIDDATRLRMFRAGELDVAQIGEGAQLALARRDLAARLHTAPAYSGGWVGLNLRRPALDDVRVRTALALLVDRKVLVERVRALGERPSESLVPDAVADYAPHARMAGADWPMAQRRTEAGRLLAAAGVDRSRPRRLVAIFSANPLTQRTFLALDAMWAPAGVRIEARGLESRAYNQALAQRDFDLMDYGPFSVVQSATSFIGRFRSDSFLNYSGYASADVDRGIDIAERSLDAAARARGYRAVEALLLRDWPVIPLYSGVAHQLVAARVTGWNATPALSLPSRFLSLPA